MRLSIVIPCRDEEETVASVVNYCDKDYEIIVVDNGSSDRSAELARAAGATVIVENKKGYGNAIMAGIVAASGEYVFIADADHSYDVTEAERFLQYATSNNLDLVVGCRFDGCGGELSPGAMPWTHRYIGNPLLTSIGKKLFGIKLNDFHCGIRIGNRQKIIALGLQSTGMEFASEMIISAHQNHLKLGELGINLYRSKRILGRSHLRPCRDGFRHIFLMLKLFYASHK